MHEFNIKFFVAFKKIVKSLIYLVSLNQKVNKKVGFLFIFL